MEKGAVDDAPGIREDQVFQNMANNDKFMEGFARFMLDKGYFYRADGESGRPISWDDSSQQNSSQEREQPNQFRTVTKQPDQ